MIMALYIVGVICIIVSILIGLFSGGFWFFLLLLAIGFVIAFVLFALAMLLERQETMLEFLQQQNQFLRQQFGTEAKECANCHYEFDAALSSCPCCGDRS